MNEIQPVVDEEAPQLSSVQHRAGNLFPGNLVLHWLPMWYKSMVDEPQLNQFLMDGVPHCDLFVDVEHSTSAMKIKFNIRFYARVNRLVSKHLRTQKRSNCNTLFL